MSLEDQTFSVEEGGLFLISPPKKKPAAREEVEERISVCLAKFAPRAKLGFGTVNLGKQKAIPVEVVVPAAKTSAQEVVVQITQQYNHKGKSQPVITDAATGEPLVGGLQLPSGSDRAEFHVVYAPRLEDTNGVLGSISLLCHVEGLVLKGELSVSAKAAAPPAPAAKGKPPTGSLTARSLSSSMKPATKPPTVATNSTSHAAVPVPLHTASKQPMIGSLSQRGSLGLHKPTASSATPAAPGALRAAAPSQSLQVEADTSGSSSPSQPDAAGVRDQEENTGIGAIRPDEAEEVPCTPVATRPATQPTIQATQGLSLAPTACTTKGPYQPKTSLSLSGLSARGAAVKPPAKPSQASGATTSRASALPPSPTPSGPSSVGGMSSRSALGGVYGSARKSPNPNKPPNPVLAKAAGRTLMHVHTEAPLAKQERALVGWLNSHLAAFGTEFNKLHAEEVGHALALQRLSAQARGILWRLYKKGSGIYDTLLKVSSKIDGNYFTLTDTPLVADVRQVQLMMEPLMSYHPFWLRVGLLTVLRGGAGGEGPDGAGRRGLQALVREGLLLEKDMQGASDKQGFWADARGHILKNFLMMVVLLDVALSSPNVKLPKGTPPLFALNSKHKSSKEVVRAFLSGRMSGIGDAVHHLELWGFRVEHAQQAADEFDYAVRNLREDLRSGIRLAKLYELLTGLPSLLRDAPGKWQLWMSPVTDQQRTDNVGKVLDKFHVLGVLPPQGQRILTNVGPLPLRARDITDASRELTLGMLWNIALKWQVPKLVDTHTLRTEVRRILRLVAAKTRRPAPEPLDIYPDQRRVSLLLKWVAAVGMLHGLRVFDFTSSFGDGRALCYLVNMYLPEWLPVDQIYQPDAPKPEDVAILIEGDEDVDMETLRHKGWAAVYEAGGCIDDKGLLKSYKEGVRNNFGLVHSVAERLGRVPEMLNADDFLDGGLEEKCVILYVSHLASRLLELSAEDRAAHIITQALRRHLWTKKYGPKLQNQAAVVMQKYWRRQVAMRQLVALRKEAVLQQAQAEADHRSCAAITIQAAWRGYQARDRFGYLARFLQRVLHTHAALVAKRSAARAGRAAVVIQAMWRRHAAQSAYQEQLRGFTRMQATWRMFMQRRSFLAQRGAAILIQRTVRSHLINGRRKAQRAAAITIQAAWRGAVARKRFLQHRRAATAIQSAWRGHIVRNGVRQQTRAATALQAVWRGHMQRALVARMHSAATKIQAQQRAYVARKQFVAVRHAAIAVQAAWRGHAVRQSLHQQVKAATAIQAVWRGHVARQQVRMQARAATYIQAVWRGAVVRRQVAAQHTAATCIQTAFRGRRCLAAYHQKRGAATRIQAAWRGHAFRQQLRVQNQAAATIQAAWRGTSVRKHLAQHRSAAVRIQAAYRAHCCQLAYHRQRQVIITIQAAWRGHSARAQHRRMHSAATIIQAAWRGVTVRKHMAQQQAAAVRLQAAYRAYTTQAAYHRQRQAIIAIQAAWRGHSARAQHRRMHSAATIIQAAWRGVTVRKHMAQQQAAVVRIQAAYRAYTTQAAYHRQRRAIIAIQAAWRGHCTRAQCSRMHAAATAIAAAWRGSVVRRMRAQQHVAATRIQSAFRCFTAQQAFLQARTAATHMQAAWRGHVVRQQVRTWTKAATVIQACARGHAVRVHLKSMHHAASVIQAGYRGYTQRASFMAMRTAAITIQSMWRGYMVRSTQTRARNAAVIIQRSWRCMRVQRQFSWARSSAVRIQAAVRMWLAQRQLARAKAAAVCIQSLWRRHQAKGVLAQHKAASVIQAAYRGHVVRVHVSKQHAAASVIQATMRMVWQRRAYAGVQRKVLLVQSAVRGWQARNRAEERRGAIVLMQSLWRRRQAQQVAAMRCSELRVRNTAATVIQSHARVWLARRAAVLRAQRIVMVQAAARRFLACRRAAEVRAIKEFEAVAKAYMHKFKCVCLLQGWWRAVLVRREYGPVLAAKRQARHELRAAQVIQHAYRAHLVHRSYQAKKQALATITAALPMLRARMALLRARRAAGAEHHAAVTIQSYVRMWQARKRTAAIIHKVTRVQALWRGYLVRKSDGRAKAEARKRLAAAEEASMRNPSRTLGARVRDALEQLAMRKDPAQLSQAVQALIIGTRYSVCCCELIALEGGVSALLRLIRGLNRSKPHMDLLLGVLSVLQHICAHAHLLPAVFQAEDCLTVLSERLQFFRDTEDVFMAAASVVVALVKPDAHALEAAGTHGVVKQWEGIAQIISRKIDMERKYICRLEGQKGSDASAKEATRKLLAAAKQLEALQGVIARVTAMAMVHGIQVEHHNVVPHALGSTSSSLLAPNTHSVPEDIVPAGASSTQLWQPKNTLVRGVLKEVTYNQQLMQAAAAAAAAEAAANLAASGSSTLGAVKMLASVVSVMDAGTKDIPPPTPGVSSRPGTSMVGMGGHTTGVLPPAVCTAAAGPGPDAPRTARGGGTSSRMSGIAAAPTGHAASSQLGGAASMVRSARGAPMAQTATSARAPRRTGGV